MYVVCMYMAHKAYKAHKAHRAHIKLQFETDQKFKILDWICILIVSLIKKIIRYFQSKSLISFLENAIRFYYKDSSLSVHTRLGQKFKCH